MIVKFGKIQLGKIEILPFVEILLFLYISSVIIFSMIPVGNIISKLIGLILLYYFIIFEVIINKRKIYFSREMKAGVIWLMFCFISAIVAINLNLVVVKIQTLLQLSIFFILGYSVILQGRVQIRAILFIFIFSVFAIFFYGLITQVNPAVLVTQNRLTGTVGDPNTLSVLGAFGFIFSLYIFQTGKSRGYKWFFLLITGIILYGIVLTQSRQGIIVALAGLIIYYFIQNLYKFQHSENRTEYLMKFILFLILSIIALGIVYYLFQQSDYSYRINAFIAFVKLSFKSSNEQVAKIIDYSSYERKQLIRYGIQIWLDHPIFGIGLDNFRVIIKHYNPIGNRLYSHNNYIELLATIGTIGTIAYYAIYASILSKLYYLQKKLPSYSERLKLIHLFMTIMFSLMIVELVTVTYYIKYIWVTLLIIIAFTDRMFKEEKDQKAIAY